MLEKTLVEGRFIRSGCSLAGLLVFPVQSPFRAAQPVKRAQGQTSALPRSRHRREGWGWASAHCWGPVSPLGGECVQAEARIRRHRCVRRGVAVDKCPESEVLWTGFPDYSDAESLHVHNEGPSLNRSPVFHTTPTVPHLPCLTYRASPAVRSLETVHHGRAGPGFCTWGVAFSLTLC